MNRGEAHALGKLAGDAGAGTVSLAEGLHRAIFARSAAGAGTPTKIIHDGVSTVVYGGLRGVLRGVGYLTGAGVVLARSADGHSLKDSGTGGLALGALSGLHGDALDRERNSLAIEMALRERRRDVPISRSSLVGAFPNASSRLVVFVHGLCGTEEPWWWFGGRSSSYGSRLQRDLGFTPLYVRYNTGLHISENGHQLARLLADVVDAWPTAVEEVVLVGHSMGGLVARSACHYGEESDEHWTTTLRHVFCLGSPHLGAPLEKAANVAGWMLSRLPETRPLARIVNGRSEGIKDLRYGYVIDEDWTNQDPDALLEDHRQDIPFCTTATYYYIGATVIGDPDHPFGRLIGDLLVLFPSASGCDRQGQRIPFEIDNGHHAHGLTHLHLLNHPDVYRQIHGWLTAAPPAGFVGPPLAGDVVR